METAIFIKDEPIYTHGRILGVCTEVYLRST